MSNTAGWRVEVYRHGELVVTIEEQMLAGKDITDADADLIRLCAQHLRAFAGEPKPVICECAAYAAAKGPYPSGICPDCKRWYPGMSRARAIDLGHVQAATK